VGEPGFAGLVEALQNGGIQVEPGVWSVADADALTAGPANAFVRVLVEVIDTPAAHAARA
jgi:hypothetical protein